MLAKILNGLFPVLLVVIFFCGSIIVHELGHYIAARICGLYVPRFSIGFGPRLFSKKIGDTEFCISLLPFGGYVSLPQLADLSEIEGKFMIPDSAKPVTCTSKIIVAVMGAVFNILFALGLGLIVWGTGLPTNSEMTSRVIGYVEDELVLEDGTLITSPAKQAGLRAGDEIIAIDGSEVKSFGDIQQFLALGTNKNELGEAYSDIRFLRDGKEESVAVFPVLIGHGSGLDRFRRIGVFPKQDLVIHSTYCSDDDIHPGDKLVSVDDLPILSIRTLQEYVSGKQSVNVQFSRAGNVFSKVMKVMNVMDTRPHDHFVLSDGEFDIIPCYSGETGKADITEYTRSQLRLLCTDEDFLKKYDLDDDLELTCVNGIPCASLMDVVNHTNVGGRNTYTFLRSNMPLNVDFTGIQSINVVPPSYKDVLGLNFTNELVVVHKSPIVLVKDAVSMTLKTLAGVFNHHSDVSVRNLMGPVGLFRVLGVCSMMDVRIFLWFVILINVNLAILNMLPLPVLDGGCVVLALLEKLSKDRRECIDRIFGILQTVFLFLLLGLLVYISVFDIRRWRADRTMRTEFERQIEKQTRLKL